MKITNDIQTSIFITGDEMKNEILSGLFGNDEMQNCETKISDRSHDCYNIHK